MSLGGVGGVLELLATGGALELLGVGVGALELLGAETVSVPEQFAV